MLGLIELEMVDFNVIMVTDWLSKCHATLDCRPKIVMIEFLNEPIRELKVITMGDSIIW